jgi:arabinofuranosyltransferase
MEVGLFTFLLSLSILLYIVAGESGGKRTFPFLGLILAALALTRPEGVLIFSTVSLTQLVIRRDVKGAFTIAIAFGLIYVPYFLWRYSYYGFLLPNTFYAKVGSSMDQVIRGMIYAIRFAFAASLLILFSLFAVPTLKRTKLLILLHVIGAYAIYVVLVGGDIMPAFRFFTPILPLLCIMAAFGLYSVVHKPRLAILLAFGIAASNFVLFRIHPQMYRYIRSDTVAIDGKEAGLWLKEHAPPDSVLATNTGGSIPYYSRLKTIDMLGLNDVHIAHRRSPEVGKGPAGHEKGDGAYVLSRMPEYIQFGSSLGSTRPLFLSDVEIYQDPSFHDQYVLSSHPLEFGKQLILYERRNP